MIIRRIPINALQKGIYSILSQYQTTDVYDGVPENAAMPYILISDYEYEVQGAKTTDITEITFELEVWTDYGGKAEVNSISEEIATVLTAWPIDLSEDNFKVLSQTVRGGRGTRQDDLFYGIVYFVAQIQNLGG